MHHLGGYNPAALSAVYSMHQSGLHHLHPGYRPSTHALSLAERLAGMSTYYYLHENFCNIFK